MDAKFKSLKFTSHPPWHFAPPWAKYLAFDLSGLWVWFEHKPVKKKNHWDGRCGREEATLFYAPKKHRFKFGKSMMRVRNYGATEAKEILNRNWAWLRGEIDIHGNKISNGR